MKTPLAPRCTSFASLMKCIGLYVLNLFRSVIIDKNTGKCKYNKIKTLTLDTDRTPFTITRLYNVTPAIEDMLYPNVTPAEERNTSKDIP